ncbi:MAG: Bax inhibitor-1/YccA family protein [Ethanoligenens sp.]
MPKLSNPAFREDVLKRVHQEDGYEALTIKGTANKAIFLAVLLVLSGAFTFLSVSAVSYGLLIGLVIIGTALSIITIFAPKAAFITAPAYTIVEGLLLGIISKIYAGLYNGIVFDAIVMTVAILGISLFCFRAGLIKVTRRFRTVVLTATGGVAAIYVIDLIMRFFNYQVPFLNDTGWIGVLVSIVIVFIASLNFFLDFQNITGAEKYGVPKYMEWYFGFGIILTLVWLYLEVLRLISKIRN